MSVEQSARDEALEFLARRPRTVAELRARLAERGHAADSVEAVIGELTGRGWLDDRALALQFVAARAERMAHGPTRLVADLGRRGVDGAVARAAWDEAVRDGLVEPGRILARQLAKRVAPGERLERARWARVYTALLRAGFEPTEVREALSPHRGATRAPGRSDQDTHDEFG